ncbi:MAG: hypothetical protein SF053_18160 [Bacteroidia bacterium]|nr:hypothetical protein [Bacteroidia bacterium]
MLHLLLLVMVPLLRLPGFLGGMYMPEESLLLVTGTQVADADHLYTDAWFAGPPLAVWIFAIFSWVFGSGALIAIRIGACLYVYLTAVYFNGLISEYKVLKRYTGLPALLLVVLLCIPWYGQEVSVSLLSLLPVMIAFQHMLRLGEGGNYAPMFLAGLWIMIATLLDYKNILFVGGVLLTYFSLHRAQTDELVSFAAGLIFVAGMMLTGLFLARSVGDWWETGVLYYLDRLSLTGNIMYQPSSSVSLLTWIWTWLPVLVVAVIGVVHFRMRYFSYIVKIRAVETVMFTWLLTALIMMSLKFARLGLSDFLLMTPPLVFYASKVPDFALAHRLRWLLLVSWLTLPLVQYGAYIGLRFPDTGLTAAPRQVLLHGGIKLYKTTGTLYDRMQTVSDQTGIWIMDDQPAWYHWLQKKCANKYADYRIAYYRLTALPGASYQTMLSGHEADRYVFEAFFRRPPDVIIDPKGNFPSLQQRYPSLFQAYHAEKADTVTLYIRKPPAG